MSGCRIYLFVDTNLLIQCRPLGELDWSPWDSFEEVQLIVSRPVLREIDYRKNKGNDRVGNRARAVAAMFRKMINAGQKVVHTSSPRVILAVEPQHSYAKELKDLLNYQERDDQLIGTVYEFKQCNQDKDVRLLTHDTNPLFTAKGVALKADMIPDNWLLPPENTETERKLAALKAENALLKRAEPSFAIWCVDASGTETERYEDSYAWFEPLSDAQVDELMQRLKNCFPMQDDFGSRVQAERAAAHTAIETIMGIKQVFTPATDEEIAQYRDEAYPQWLERCEYVLRNHHRALQRKTPILKFTFLSQNRGTRPATDALVTIEAEGNFNVTPPLHDGQDEEQNDEDISLAKEQATGLAACRTFGVSPLFSTTALFSPKR